ncbi:MAG: xanthine dehydrogenase family protein subunit M [Alphaproteobacteria bacterium]
MKPAPFEYFAPETLEGVIDTLARFGEAARPLAGGQSLMPLLNMRLVQPRAVVDIARCKELGALKDDGAHIRLGAMVRQATAERSEIVRRHCPLLAMTLPHVGGMANRNRGTVCGSLAHADPLAELPAVALALDAEFVIAGTTGQRRVAARDFFVSALTTAVRPGELLESVLFPKAGPTSKAVFLEVGNRRHGFATVGLALQVDRASQGRMTNVRLAAIGASPTPVRLSASEHILEGQVPSDEIMRAARAAADEDIDPPTDIHASAAYRRRVLGTLVERAVTALAQSTH